MPRGKFDRTPSKIKRATQKAHQDYRAGYQHGIKMQIEISKQLGTINQSKEFIDGVVDALNDYTASVVVK